MEPRKEIIINEELKSAIKMMAEDNNSKSQNDMLDILMKSKLLIPVKISPAAKRDDHGTYILSPKHKITFATVKNYQDMKNPDWNYFIGFTDTEEFKAWAGNKDIDAFLGDFNDFAVMLLKPDAACKGFVLNPAGGNVCFTTDVVKQIIKRRDAK